MLKKVSVSLGASFISIFLLGAATPAEAFTWNSYADTAITSYVYQYPHEESVVEYVGEQTLWPIEDEESMPTLPAYSGNTGSYTVKWGDTLWVISQKLGVSVNSLRTVNNLWHDSI